MTRILAFALVVAATPLFAGDITVQDAYARASRPGAPTGAMFMTIRNSGEAADRLLAAESPVAQLVELHTHIDDNGVMRMRPVEGGLEIPAGGEHMLMRGGDHVMLMGLKQELAVGDTFSVTLNFEESIVAVTRRNLTAILAHPERYAYLHQKPQTYRKYKEQGILFQLNMLSLGDYYGPDVHKVAGKLLEEGLIDFVASDAHGPRHLKALKEIRLKEKEADRLLPVIHNTIETFF